LDIAEGLKQLLIEADVTIDSIINLGYQELSEMLHIDLYVGELIIEAVKNLYKKEISIKRYHNTQLSCHT
jgi:hypothetical protein